MDRCQRGMELEFAPVAGKLVGFKPVIERGFNGLPLELSANRPLGYFSLLSLPQDSRRRGLLLGILFEGDSKPKPRALFAQFLGAWGGDQALVTGPSLSPYRGLGL